VEGTTVVGTVDVGTVVDRATFVDVVRGGKAAFLAPEPELHPAASNPTPRKLRAITKGFAVLRTIHAPFIIGSYKPENVGRAQAFQRRLR
jgi:hypothetical protein